MSIVPYNSSREILLHSPNEGILVVRDSQQNTVELISTISKSSDPRGSTNPQFKREPFGTKRFPAASSGGTHNCPNCGFSWSDYPANNRNSGDGSSDLRNIPIVDPIESIAIAQKFPKGFMHHDYFKLLSQLENATETSSNSIPYHSLPQDIFNQGYFKRFFKKVPPYELGSGAHAQVYKVVHVLNEIKLGTYAVKRISIGDRFELLEQVLNEVLILYELSVKGANENNLIRYNHVWLELGDIDDSSTFIISEGNTSSRKESTKIPYVFILQQYCGGGHLEDLVKNNFLKDVNLSWKDKIQMERLRRRASRGEPVPELQHEKKWLNEFEIWKFFRDVANGVNYLHFHGILHRDLKPSNCLLDIKYDIDDSDQATFESIDTFELAASKLPKVLVSDFGEGQIIDKRNIPETNISFRIREDTDERRGNTGTLEFTAPELWLFTNYDPALGERNKKFINDFSYESDIYSLGLILCYLCCGSLPFSKLIAGETDPQVIRDKIIEWYFSMTPNLFHEWFELSSKIGSEKSSVCSGDFESLIYVMIKGGDSDGNGTGSSRINSSEVIEILESIKWDKLVKDNSSRKNSGGHFDPTISNESTSLVLGDSVKHQKDTSMYDPLDSDTDKEPFKDEPEDDEASDEEDLLNLAEVAKTESRSSISSLVRVGQFAPQQPATSMVLQNFATIPFYILQLGILEFLSFEDATNLKIGAKLVVLVFMLVDTLQSRTQVSKVSVLVACSATVVAMLGADMVFESRERF